MLRPDGITRDLLLVGRGRDIATTAGGGARVLAESSAQLRVDYLDGRRISELRTDPRLEELSSLVGAKAASGFRARLAEVAPAEQRARSLLHLLLDDVPGAALVSGYAVGAAGASPPPAKSGYTPVPDLCAGWRTGGTIMLEIGKSGRPPLVTGPPAPPLISDEDPLAWHPMPPLPPTGMRRQRCLDLVPGEAGAPVTVISLFRDSHCDAGGDQTVIHEYEVQAQVDPADWRVLEIVATPRVLPWQECPAAAGSASRLVGRTVHELRSEVRVEFTGTSTCTHLNDQLRSLADLVALGDYLDVAPS